MTSKLKSTTKMQNLENRLVTAAGRKLAAAVAAAAAGAASVAAFV